MQTDVQLPRFADVFPDAALDSYDALVTHIYDGVMAAQGFEAFVAALATAFRLKAVTMIIHNAVTHEVRGLWLHGITPEWVASYALEFAAQDTLAQHMGEAPIARFYASNLDIAQDDRVMRTRFYKEWLAPQHVAAAAGGIILREGDWCTQIIVQRTHGQGAFNRAELGMFDRLMPHMRRAIQMRERMTKLQQGQDFLASGLDMLAIPTLLFDEQGHVAHMNRRAAALLAGPGPLRMAGRHLTTADVALSRKLNFEIGNAIAASRGAQVAFSDVVHAASNQRVPITLLIAPMRTAVSASQTQGAAVLFIFDPAEQRPLTVGALRRLFGLTNAHAELAVALCAGKSLEEAAIERGVSTNTVRSQLKAMFLKTGTSRQAELVSLILSSPAYLIAENEQTLSA